MGKANFFSPNNPNKICDICGHKMKANMLRKTWDGKLACLPNDCWSPKHPFDSPLPVVVDSLLVRSARPEPADVFLHEPGLSIWGGAWISVDNGTVADPYWNELTDLWDNY